MSTLSVSYPQEESLQHYISVLVFVKKNTLLTQNDKTPVQYTL